jgi:endonuclease-8
MEGPSLVILREELQPFLGKKVLEVRGNTKQPKESLKGSCLTKIDTWAKNLFLVFSSPRGKTHLKIVTKTHFMMFGSYRINDPKPNQNPRLQLKFKTGILYFYSCSIQFDAEAYLNAVDRKVDLMSEEWDEKYVIKRMEEKKNSFLCDLFLDQSVFAGSGNIVKNEVLFNIRKHPLTKLSQIGKKDWSKIARAVRDYCFCFYEWKKKFELRKHWQVYRKFVCPICSLKLKKENTGKFPRKSFYCSHCQKLRSRSKKLKVFSVLPIPVAIDREERFDH